MKSNAELESILRGIVKRVVEQYRQKHKIPDDSLPGSPPMYQLPNGENLMRDIANIQFGVRCIMALGGFKMKPLTMTDAQIKERSDVEMTRIVNTHIMLKAAEKIILKAGLREDFIEEIERLEKQVNEVAKNLKPAKLDGDAIQSLAKTLAGEASKGDGKN